RDRLATAGLPPTASPARGVVRLPAPPPAAAPPAPIAIAPPVAFSPTAPPSALTPVPLTLTPPALITDTSPPPLWLTPVTESVVAVLFRLMAPLVVFVALNDPSVFALGRVVPPIELVVRAVADKAPAPVSAIVP